MPQLDNLIILSQIFWLILIFSIFYFIVTYYFLPKILKSIKVRKYFLEYNIYLNFRLTKKITEERKKLMDVLFKNFSDIKYLIFNKIFITNLNLKQDFLKQKYTKLTNFILIASMKSISYCNLSLLNSLKFYPLFLNKQKKK
uniref:ATP synthase F0 subunit 8 n=1 Tax=Osmundea sinicola TaxID=290685 RepID=A0A7L4WP01_9FLOR|nr:ATP synthase F0 subunit 8 [Osmundea sinicola]QFR99789.1 ATP synthase F0 subunit 8 [Osmundea sinicola]